MSRHNSTRRTFVKAFGLGTLGLSFFDASGYKLNAKSPRDLLLYVGTYTSGKSEGIYIYRMNRRAYPTDLSDEQWLIVSSYVQTSGYGRPPLHSKRELLNGIFSRLGRAVPGTCCRTTCGPGARFTSNLRLGARMGPGTG